MEYTLTKTRHHRPTYAVEINGRRVGFVVQIEQSWASVHSASNPKGPATFSHGKTREEAAETVLQARADALNSLHIA